MTVVLLDTHALVWWIIAPERISRRAHSTIVDPETPAFISAASAYEIEFKRGREVAFERLPVPIASISDTLEMGWLPVSVQNADLAGRLLRDHRDPWDRVLAGQAIQHDLALVTIDARIHRIAHDWGVKVLW